MKLPWLLTGNLIYAISQWIILLIFTRNFSTIEVGQYFFALALCAPIFLLLSCRLPSLIITNKEILENKDDVYFFKLFSNLFSILIFLTIYIVFFRENTSFFIAISILIYKALEQYDDIFISYKQVNLDFKSIFFIKALRSIFFVSLNFFFSFFLPSLELSLLYSTLIYLIFWFLRNYNEKFFIVRERNIDNLISIFRNGIYLSSSSFLSSLATSGSRIYIGYILGNSVLAVYGVLSYSLVALNIFISALGQYFISYFVRYKDNKKLFLKEIYKSQLIIYFLIFPVLIIIYFFGDFLLKILYGDKYGNYGLYLLYIFIAGLFKSSSALLGTVATALKVYRFQLKFTIFITFLTLILLPVFINYYGFLGAIYAFMLINIIELVIYIFAIKGLISNYVKSL